jgi:glutamate mutase epsilon subunit
MSMRSEDIPKEISDAKLDEWYTSLSDQHKIMLNRYSKKADTSSGNSFLSSVADAALADNNYSFAVTICESCLTRDTSKLQIFNINETLIDAYIGTKRYDDAKRICEENLKIAPSLLDEIKARNCGKIPEKMNCRNRYVDIIVGIESGYDKAFELLDRFFSMNLISEEDLAFRKQSLKIHRLQRSFDGVYTYTYKN